MMHFTRYLCTILSPFSPIKTNGRPIIPSIGMVTMVSLSYDLDNHHITIACFSALVVAWAGHSPSEYGYQPLSRVSARDIQGSCGTYTRTFPYPWMDLLCSFQISSFPEQEGQKEGKTLQAKKEKKTAQIFGQCPHDRRCDPCSADPEASSGYRHR